jgi:hypothetical protein
MAPRRRVVGMRQHWAPPDEGAQSPAQGARRPLPKQQDPAVRRHAMAGAKLGILGFQIVSKAISRFEYRKQAITPQRSSACSSLVGVRVQTDNSPSVNLASSE